MLINRFCLVTNAYGKQYEELAKLVYPTRKAYSEMHGYGCYRTNYPGFYAKLVSLIEFWDKAEWLWWLDIDAHITNNKIKLESLIEGHEEFVINCDMLGMNAGSFLVRTTNNAKKLLQDILQNKNLYGIHWPDQTAMSHMLWNIHKSVSVIPQRAMNSYPDYKRNRPEEIWQTGDFVFHCPGLLLPERHKLLKEKTQ